jgi:hypothetical protein
MTFEGMAGIAVGLAAIVAPEWLPKMGKITRNVITLAGIIIAAFSALLLLEDLTGMKVQHGPLATMVVGAIIIGAGVFWHVHMSKAQISAAESNNEAKMNTPPKKPSESVTQNNYPKEGDVIGGFSVGGPRSGAMPQAGDTLGSMNFGGPRQGTAQIPSGSSSAESSAPAGGGSSNYSIGNIYDNRGIIQQGPNNTVNLAPKPELRGLKAEKVANADGSYTHQYLVEWTAEFPGDWRVLAYAKDVVGINIPAAQHGWSGVREDHAFTTITRPHGRYVIVVRTKSDSMVELKHELTQ